MSAIREHVRALNDQRVKAHAALNAHTDAWYRDHPGQPMSAEARAIEARFETEISDLEHEIRKHVDRETRENESAAVRNANPALFGGSEPAPAGSSVGSAIVRAVEDVMSGRVATAQVPLEVRNTVTESGDWGQGVPIQFGDVQRTLRARSVVLSLPGLRTVTMTSDKLRFPRLDESTVEHVSEAAQITEDDPDLDAITLTAKKYGTYTEISSELGEDFSADAMDVLGSNMLNALALKVDLDLLEGTGAGGVVGLRNWPGINTTSVAGVPTNFAKFREVEYELDAANANLTNAVWLMHPRSWWVLGGIKTGISSDETTLLEPNPQQGPRTLLGYGVRTSSQITLTEGAGAGSWVGLVDGSQLVVGVRRPATVEISRDFKFDEDVIAMRATARYGFAVINAGGVSIATDVRAS